MGIYFGKEPQAECGDPASAASQQVVAVERSQAPLGSVDARVDIDDTGVSEMDAELNEWANLPSNERETVLACLSLSDDQLERHARSANNQVGHNQETRLAREARLVWIIKAMAKGFDNTTMAVALGISIRRLSQLKKEVHQRVRRQISKIDMGCYAGFTMQFYEDAAAMLMNMASQGSTPQAVRISALLAAMRAKKDQQTFLGKLGVFKNFNQGDDLVRRLQTELTGQDGAEASLTDVAMAFKAAAAQWAKDESMVNVEDANIVQDDDLHHDGSILDEDGNVIS